MKMKVSLKAALFSAFVFPGAGQLYLKVYGRGLVIMLLSGTGLGYIIWSTVSGALQHLDDVMVKMQGSAMNLQDISGIVGSGMSAIDPYKNAIFYFIVCLWIFAIIDAYIIGKQKETQHTETSSL